MFLFLYLADSAHAVADGMTTGTVNEGDVSEAEISHPLFPDQRKSIRHAPLTTLGVVALWLFMTLGPDTPLIDEAVSPEAQLTPYYQYLVSGFMALFLLAGWAYSRAAGIIKNHRDLVRMMSESTGDMAYFLVLAFARQAVHFNEHARALILPSSVCK